MSRNGKTQNLLKWEDGQEIRNFRDPVYGYISVPKIYVKYLIDTPWMQRLKGVSQTGFRPLFPSSTHDRFAHSLGVYHFAIQAYDSLRKSIRSNFGKQKERLINDSNIEEFEQNEKDLEWCLDFWKVLLSIASLLHDVGHPAFSHDLEFLYDDIFMVFPHKNKPARCINMKSPKEFEKWYRFNKNKHETYQKTKLPDNRKLSYKTSALKRKLEERFSNFEDKKIKATKIKGNPHERMSAYMILSESKDIYN